MSDFNKIIYLYHLKDCGAHLTMTCSKKDIRFFFSGKEAQKSVKPSTQNAVPVIFVSLDYWEKISEGLTNWR